MPASNKGLFKASGNMPAPQYFNKDTDSYEAQEGKYGASAYLQRGTIAMEAWEGSSNATKTFPSNRYGFSVMNDGTADLTFTINGQTRKVKPGEGYNALFPAFTTMQINATTPYRAEVLE